MAKRLQHRGGTTSQHSTFTGAVREVTVDTDKNTLVVHDGATAGGHPLATATNFTSTGIDDNATSTALTIDSSENVIINSGSLSLVGTNTKMSASSNGNDIVFSFNGTDRARLNNGGLFSAGDGSAVVPSYRFFDDADTGMFRPSSNNIAFSTNTSERMRIDSSGRLVIGATSAITASKLTINGEVYQYQTANGTFNNPLTNGGYFQSINGTARSGMRFTNEALSNTRMGIVFECTDTSGSPAEAMRIDSSGNVGIGTTSPSRPLDIVTSNNVPIRTESSATTNYLQQTNSGGTTYIASTGGNFFIATGGGGLERMRIDSSGNVGIGTASPDRALHISGTSSETIRVQRTGSTGGVGTLYTNDNGTLGIFGIPSGANTGSFITNGTASLGTSVYRWQDAYLSGGLYVGGTGTANKLDDYEEGTFTATLKGSSTEPATLITTTGYYTKIGRLLKFQLGFEGINTTGYSGGITVIGLPFANFTGARSMVNVGVFNLATFSSSNYVMGPISLNDTLIGVQQFTSNGLWSSVTHNVTTNGYLWMTGTYTTA